MAETIKAADTSRFASANLPVPLAVLDTLKGQGVSLFIPGTWHGATGYDPASETLKRARSMGLLTATYTAHTRRGHGAQDVVEAYKRCGETEWRNLKFVALDMEWSDPGTDPNAADYTDLVAGIDKVLTLGQRPILYTAAWWWRGVFGNPDIPHGLPLWNAFYDNDPDYDFHRYPYGGPGVKLVGEQYTNTTPVGSIAVDYNTFDKAWVTEGPGAENGLEILLRAWKEDMADTIKGAAALHAQNIVPTQLGLFGIRQVQKAQNWAKLIGPGK